MPKDFYISFLNTRAIRQVSNSILPGEFNLYRENGGTSVRSWKKRQRSIHGKTRQWTEGEEIRLT